MLANIEIESPSHCQELWARHGNAPTTFKHIFTEKRTEQELLTIEHTKMVDCHIGNAAICSKGLHDCSGREDYVDAVGQNNRARAMVQQWIEKAKEFGMPRLETVPQTLLSVR